jgi:hypothetical protein
MNILLNPNDTAERSRETYFCKTIESMGFDAAVPQAARELAEKSSVPHTNLLAVNSLKRGNVARRLSPRPVYDHRPCADRRYLTRPRLLIRQLPVRADPELLDRPQHGPTLMLRVGQH